MKPRIYYNKNTFDNWSIVFRYPKKMQTPQCRGIVEIMHCDDLHWGLWHCAWVDSVVGEHYGKFVRFIDAPMVIQARVEWLTPIWERACRTGDWSYWNEV